MYLPKIGMFIQVTMQMCGVLIFIECVTFVFVVASQQYSYAMKVYACMVVHALNILAVESIVFAHPGILDGIGEVSVYKLCVCVCVRACVRACARAAWVYVSVPACVCVFVRFQMSACAYGCMSMSVCVSACYMCLHV